MLIASKPDLLSDSRNIRFARAFAIAWRVVIAATITTCLIARVLLLRQVVSFPIGDDEFTREAFPDALLEFAMIFVLIRIASGAAGYQAIGSQVCASTIWPPGLVATMLAVVVLPEAYFITFLVHIATQNIEHGTAPQISTTRNVSRSSRCPLSTVLDVARNGDCDSRCCLDTGRLKSAKPQIRRSRSTWRICLSGASSSHVPPFARGFTTTYFQSFRQTSPALDS